MKITSSTSITSMYGTTLIWLRSILRRATWRRSTARSLRARPAVCRMLREFLDERLVARGEAVDVVRVAVVRDDGRDRGEEADRGGDQRLGDARRDLRERRLRDVREAAERIHDAPHGAEQADVGRHRADGREAGQVRVERVDLALVRRAHRAARRVERERRARALPAVLRVLAEARREDVLEPAAVARLRRALEQLGEVAALPELVLEAVGVALRASGAGTS